MFYLNSSIKGNDILLRYIDNNNNENRVKINNYKPSLFVKTVQDSKYKDLVQNNNLNKVQFNSIKEAKHAIFDARNTRVEFYGNRNFNLTFLHENFKENYNSKLIRTFIIDIECPSDNGFPDPMIAEHTIDAITIYDNLTDCFYLFSLYDFDINDPKSIELDKYKLRNKIKHKKFNNELDLLNGMLGFWNNNTPVNISGWNSSQFDMPYIYNRLIKLGISPNKLSPWGVVKAITKTNTFQKEYQQVYILGVNDLDYLELYKKNRFKTRESYKLGFIGEVESISGKVDYSDEASNLRTLHKVNTQKYQVYNIIDVYIPKKLEDKLGFFDTTFNLGYLAGINFGDVKSPVGLWESIIYKNTINKNIIMPPKKENNHQDYGGGFVLSPKIGKHKWLISIDLNSLYPHLIMQYNISPEKITNCVVDTNVDKMLNEDTLNITPDITVTPNGCTYKTDNQGIIPMLMETLYNERKEIKKEMLVHHQNYLDSEKELKYRDNNSYNNYKELSDDELKIYCDAQLAQYNIKNGSQLCRKLALNSCYGALANVYFSLYDIRLADSITTSGQLSIRWINKKITKYLNDLLNTTDVRYVYATDTDSTMFSAEIFVKKYCKSMNTEEIVDFLDQWCKNTLEPKLDEWYQELADYTQAFQQKMQMAREMIANSAFFVAKKRYAANVLDMEGVRYSVENPYVKIQGLDLVKSSTPAVCRIAMLETVKIILQGDEKDMQNLIKEFKIEYQKMSPEQIAIPRGVNKLEESYCKPDRTFRNDVTVPINSRAAINYNNLLLTQQLNNYEIIKNADKMRFLYLEEPNKLNQNVIGFIDLFPKEFNLDRKIDYDTMFYKTFLKPMDAIAEVIGWETKPSESLDSLYN